MKPAPVSRAPAFPSELPQEMQALVRVVRTARRSVVTAGALPFVLALALGSPLAWTSSPARASTPVTAAEAEIRALLDRLATSGCRFERNGRWHAATEARDHLARKLARARALGREGDAETFIEHAATRSSLTGRPYRVACGDAAPVAAGHWLRQRLDEQRRGSPAGSGIGIPPSPSPSPRPGPVEGTR